MAISAFLDNHLAANTAWFSEAIESKLSCPGTLPELKTDQAITFLYISINLFFAQNLKNNYIHISGWIVYAQCNETNKAQQKMAHLSFP